MSKNEIKEAMLEAIDERFKLPHGQHNADHDWVKLQREKQRIKVARLEKWKTSAGGAIIIGILSIVGFLLTWVWNHTATVFTR